MGLEFLPSPKDLLDGATEFGLGMVYGGLEMPIDGITQLFNAVSPVDLPELNIVDPKEHDSFWFKAGIVGGVALDTVLLSAAVNVSLANYATAHKVSAPFLKAAVKGFALSALQPVPEGENFWASKGLNTGLRMVTMQAGAGISHLAVSTGFFGEAASRTHLQELSFRGITGLPKGAVNTQISSLWNGRGFASPVDTMIGAIKSSANSIAGGAFKEAFDHLQGDEHPPEMPDIEPS